MMEKEKAIPLSDFGDESAWVTYISPYVFVVPEGKEPIKISVEEINRGSYNHGDLCRIVGSFSIATVKDLRLLVCYDGAIAIPKFGQLASKENAVVFLNNFYAMPFSEEFVVKRLILEAWFGGNCIRKN
jgi:hypothetical protein